MQKQDFKTLQGLLVIYIFCTYKKIDIWNFITLSSVFSTLYFQHLHPFASRPLICKVSVVSFIALFSALKMFSKYEQRCFIKLQIARRKNAQQCHTALLKFVVERLYYIVPWLDGDMHSSEGDKMFIDAIQQL